MSHCCGGCGGEDPLMKNKEADAKAKESAKTSEEAKASDKPLKAETWQPAGK